MAHEIITPDDLEQFRLKLLEDLKAIIQPAAAPKKWLRSSEVRKMLGISPGTLQNLRVNGTLHPTKIGGIFYYQLDEITSLFEKSANGF